ncbi:hypothetical protein [Streptoalloteichus hindustanus]|uniref:hypothetical protein n=1 Tax=Streptoalloteichus hindustanus TaxID=2017 RepID=UPI0011613432|nr:hypothetical protein [Streptoalloteichus hindustanus]
MRSVVASWFLTGLLDSDRKSAGNSADNSAGSSGGSSAGRGVLTRHQVHRVGRAAAEEVHQHEHRQRHDVHDRSS